MGGGGKAGGGGGGGSQEAVKMPLPKTPFEEGVSSTEDKAKRKKRGSRGGLIYPAHGPGAGPNSPGGGGTA